MIFEAAISIFLVWIIWYILTTYQTRRNMPPGPTPFPLIGNLYNMGPDPIASFHQLFKVYGEIFTLSFPIGTCVVVNNWELAHEALVVRKNVFSGRISNTTTPMRLIVEGRDILTEDYGPTLLFRRKVFKSAMHIFGAGLEKAEERVNSAVETLQDEIESLDGRPFSPKQFVAAAIVTQLWLWLSSKECSFDHPTVKSLLEFSDKLVSISIPGSIYYAFPLLRILSTKFKRTFNEVTKIRDQIFTAELERHMQTYESGTVRDLTDSFLAAYKNEMKKETRKDIGSIDDVKGLMIDVILGGSDTTAIFISRLILYMLLYKDVQGKIHTELDKVVGRDRLPSRNDIKDLPYFQATVCEVMRYSPVARVVTHKAICDTTIKDYTIRKGTPVVINFADIHRDSKHWSEPDEFKPERFLGIDGEFIGWSKLPAFSPFGIGRRECVGETLAKIQVTLFASTLLHSFIFELPKHEKLPSFKDNASFIRFSQEYRVVARKR